MNSLKYIKKRVRKLTTVVNLGQGLLKFITVLGFGIFIYLILDYLFFLTSGIRLLFLISVCVLGLVVSVIYKFNAPQEIEAEFSEFKGRLFASLSSYSPKAGYSNELIEHIRAQTHKLLESVNLGHIIKKRLKPLLKFFICGWVPVIILTVLLPSASLWIKRFLIPSNRFISLSVYPGDVKAVYGDSLLIEVKPYGLVPRKLFLITNADRIPLYKEGQFRTVIEEVNQDITYYAELGDVSSDTHQVLVIIHPWVKNLKVHYTYPSYTKIPPFVSDIPSIEALYGAEVELIGESNVSLKLATVDFKDAPDITATVEGEKFISKFNIMQNDTYQILLLAENGLRNTPEKWPIRVWEDEPPEVELLFPGADIELPVSMRVPIIFRAMDDYGISFTKLVSEILQHRKEWLITNEIARDTAISYDWDLSPLSLLPGDVVKYWIEVYDNDAIKGPKLTKSQVYRVYFPRIEDIYERIAHEQTESISALERTVNELREQAKQLEKLGSKGELSWQDKEEIKKLLAKEKEIERRIKELAASLDALYKASERTWWVDRDSVEKLKELQNLFSELNLPKLKEAIRKAEEAIRKNPELLSRALKNLNLTQEELRKRVERTIELLKRFRNEQMLKALAEKAKELEEWQSDITERTAKGDSLSPLSKEEQALGQELDKLAQDIEKLSKEIPSLRKELEEEAERATQTESQLREASSALSRGKRALKLQRQVLSELRSLATNLNSLYQQMVQQGKEEVAQEIRKLQNDLLFLSFEEESVGADNYTPLQKAFRQEAIIKGAKIVVKQLEALTKITPFISSCTNKHLSNSLSSMEDAKHHFEERNLKRGERSQQLAMTELNKAVKELMKSADALQKACSASGFPSLMQQLCQLTQNQQQLNQLVQSLLPLNIGSSEMREQLLQLAGEQEALAKQLSEIAEGLKGKVLGDLGATAQEMERIAQELRKGVTEEIVESQKRVLKHLLDSQKSIYTKKYSRRRISEPGKDFTNLPPPPPLELITKRGISQEDILKALREKYPKEYEHLIRAYFRALSTE